MWQPGVRHATDSPVLTFNFQPFSVAMTVQVNGHLADELPFTAVRMADQVTAESISDSSLVVSL